MLQKKVHLILDVLLSSEYAFVYCDNVGLTWVESIPEQKLITEAATQRCF